MGRSIQPVAKSEAVFAAAPEGQANSDSSSGDSHPEEVEAGQIALVDGIADDGDFHDDDGDDDNDDDTGAAVQLCNPEIDRIMRTEARPLFGRLIGHWSSRRPGPHTPLHFHIRQQSESHFCPVLAL